MLPRTWTLAVGQVFLPAALDMENLTMKNLNATPWIAIAALVLIAGCGQKAQQSATTASDSLLAASPVEPAQGQLTPQTDYKEPDATQPPAPATKPASKPATKPATMILVGR